MSEENIKDFSIIGIEILSECSESVRKNLKTGYYPFVSSECKNGELIIKHTLPEDFFCKNVSISAIVGKNGSGKSTLIEFMFRLINNFSAKFLTDSIYNNEQSISSDTYGALYFFCNEILYQLKCEGEILSVHKGFNTKSCESFFFDNTPICNSGHILGVPDTKKLFEAFFYTIATNYSLQAFNSRNFFDKEDSRKTYDVSKIWINSLFHKNDGYVVPIVLNPYRDYGVINTNIEFDLTSNRFAAILKAYKDDGQKLEFIEGYTLSKIIFCHNESHVKEKYKIDEMNILKPYFHTVIGNKKTVYATFIEAYGLEENDTPYFEEAYKYLVYKTNSIIHKYPSYRPFKGCYYSIDHYNDELIFEEKKRDIEAVVNVIKDDDSHITIKIKQTLNYINYLKKKDVTNTIDMEDYCSYNFKYGINLNRLDKIITSFPPPFYYPQIKLLNRKNEEVNFSDMSSGEQQFIFIMTTIFYHIKNLQSISHYDMKRIAYHNVNLVLDEIELCFHPEYQRQFIQRLIGTIERLKLNDYFGFNIIIATHSPFILSDIPSCNILYLRDGEIANGSVKLEPFAANIHDILHQSFFLENGFIGEFAKNKIVKVIKLINSEEIKDINWPDKNKDKIKEMKQIINLIGEPLIQKKLMEMYYDLSDKYEKIKIKEEEMAKLKDEIKRLKK